MTFAVAASAAGPVDCPLCGPTAARPWFRDRGWQVVRCVRCAMLITWPRPGAGVLASIYTQPAYYHDRSMGPEAASGALDRARSLISLLPGPVARALDFGAGQGHLVAGLRSLGLQAEGVEPSEAGRAGALSQHGLRLLSNLPPETEPGWDLITSIHSLEHLEDPGLALSQLRARLRPGGFLLLEVPHAGSIEMWRRDRRSAILDLPVHLHHFTPQTLAALAASRDLDVLTIHLCNPEALEALFALRRRARDARNPRRGPEDAGPSDPTPPKRLWSGTILPVVRRVFPGWKFQLVARRPVSAVASS